MNFNFSKLGILLCLITSFSLLAQDLPGQNPDDRSVTLRILNYNAWFIPFKRKYSYQRRKLISKFLQKQQYDMVFLQELFTYRFARKIREYLPKTYVGRYPDTAKFKFNAGLYQLFKKMKILKTKFKHFGRLCGKGECLAKKGVYFLRVKSKEGLIFDVYNTHLEAHDRDFPIRKKQLEILKEFVHETSNQDGHPIIMAGDFNIHDQNQEQYEFMMNQTLFGFTDVLKEVIKKDPSIYPYTWDSKINSHAHYDQKKDLFSSARLDYIFIRSGRSTCLDIISSQVVLNQKSKVKKRLGRRYRRIFPSDHFGVEATLKAYPCPAVINE